MSLANPTAHAAGHPPTLCPYCAHVSPLDSKFCNECGAALHLVPCPQCGSISDITQTSHCSRCNCALHVSAFALSDFPDLPAEPKEPELPPVLVAESLDSGAAQAQPLVLEPVAAAAHLPRPVTRRPRTVLVGGLLLIAAAAAAAYLLVQQRDLPALARVVSTPGASSGRTTGSVEEVSKDTSPSAVAHAGPAAAASAPVPVPVPLPSLPVVTAPATLPLPVAEPAPLAATLAQPRSAATTAVAAASSPRAITAAATSAAISAINAGVPVGKPSPNAAVPPALAAAANHTGAAALRAAAFKGGSANLNRTWQATAETAQAAEAAQATEAAQAQLRNRARIAAGAGLDLPVPKIGPCTSAVAALGLCAAPEKQIPPP